MKDNSNLNTRKDIIALEGMEFYAYHGYYANEQKSGNYFTVDVYLRTDIREAAETDTLEKTINYEEVFNRVSTIMRQKHKLLEHLAFLILHSVRQTPLVEGIKVRVSKNRPPVNGNVARSYVEIEDNF